MAGRFKQSLTLLWVQAGLLTALFAINLVFNGMLYGQGILPRSLASLSGIISAPFIHRDFGHLLNNIIALSILSGLCLIHSNRFYLKASVFIILSSGSLVWCFARSANHIGASGWIFGLWSLLLYKAWTDRKLSSALIGIFVLLFYGGMVLGLLPRDDLISYEYHIFGALSGIAYGYINRPIKHD